MDLDVDQRKESDPEARFSINENEENVTMECDFSMRKKIQNLFFFQFLFRYQNAIIKQSSNQNIISYQNHI